MRMKLTILAAAASSLVVCGLARGDDDCNASMLRGLYVFSATGFNIVQGAAQPKAISEYIRFNGDGTLTVPAATVSQNGVIFRSANGMGTYTVGPDCTGRLQFGPPGPAFDLFVAPHGFEITMNQTGGLVPGVLEGRAKRLSE
jgi:hypothetical protein